MIFVTIDLFIHQPLFQQDHYIKLATEQKMKKEIGVIFLKSEGTFLYNMSLLFFRHVSQFNKVLLELEMLENCFFFWPFSSKSSCLVHHPKDGAY